MTKYIILEKARPYTRIRRMRLERVKGYVSRPRQGLQPLSHFTQIGPQLGSQPGGLYEEKSTGSKWYIKQPPTEEHARNEKLTADLYALAGIRVPRMRLIQAGEKGLGIASEWIEGLKQDPERVKRKPMGVTDGFAADAWLANWDVVGTDWDNILLDETDHAVRVDTGGGLLFRARGEKKPLDEKVTEWESMRQHRPANEVFGKITENELIASGRKVMAVTDDAIRRTVAENGFGNDLADLLIARKNAIATKVFRILAPPAQGIEPPPKDLDVGKEIIKNYIILEKAKPYTRYRRGKLEHVKGYAGKDRNFVEFGKEASKQMAVNVNVDIDKFKKLKENKEELAKIGFEYVGKENFTETTTVLSLGVKENREKVTECDVFKHKGGGKVFVNSKDPPSKMKINLTQWNQVFEAAKKWNPPDVFYRGDTVYGERFEWVEADGTKMSGAEGGFADYHNNRIVVNDDHSGWWITAHEMGHIVLGRLVYAAKMWSKEEADFVTSLRSLNLVESPAMYDKGLKVAVSLGIPLDNPKKADKMLQEVICHDKLGNKSKEEIKKVFAEQGLDMEKNGGSTFWAIRGQLQETGRAELSDEEIEKLKHFEKILTKVRKAESKYKDWETIAKTEPLRSGSSAIEGYVNAPAKTVQENFAEFYQIFTNNLFNMVSAEVSIELPWGELQTLKENNPLKFKFFVDNVFPKEYKEFRKKALERMLFIEGKRHVI